MNLLVNNNHVMDGHRHNVWVYYDKDYGHTNPHFSMPRLTSEINFLLHFVN